MENVETKEVEVVETTETPKVETKPEVQTPEPKKVQFTAEQQEHIDNLIKQRLDREKAKAQQQVEAANTLATSGIKIDEFKELKAYDKFEALKTKEERDKFIADLKEQKPNLFSSKEEIKQTKVNPLTLSGFDIKNDQVDTPTKKVY